MPLRGCLSLKKNSPKSSTFYNIDNWTGWYLDRVNNLTRRYFVGVDNLSVRHVDVRHVDVRHLCNRHVGFRHRHVAPFLSKTLLCTPPFYSCKCSRIGFWTQSYQMGFSLILPIFVRFSHKYV
jgi:hypothetical protein